MIFCFLNKFFKNKKNYIKEINGLKISKLFEKYMKIFEKFYYTMNELGKIKSWDKQFQISNNKQDLKLKLNKQNRNYHKY